jgi:hypothetical protein
MGKNSYAAAKGREPFQSYIQFPHELLHSRAWDDLTSYAKALLLGIASYYYGKKKTGPISFSSRQAKRTAKCSINRVKLLFEELESHGFIKCVFKSGYNVKNRRASEWVLTWLDHNGYKKTNDWRHWTPPPQETQQLPEKTATVTLIDKLSEKSTVKCSNSLVSGNRKPVFCSCDSTISGNIYILPCGARENPGCESWNGHPFSSSFFSSSPFSAQVAEEFLDTLVNHQTLSN